MAQTKITLTFNQQAQYDFLTDLEPGWTCYCGGLGSGKSWAAARKLLLIHLNNDSKSLLVSPTYEDILRYQLPELENAAADFGLTLINKLNTKKSVPGMYIQGCKHPILIASGDKPERITGFEIGAVWIDEGCRVPIHPIPSRDMITQVRGRLRTGNNLYGIVSTTPEGIRNNDWVYRDFVTNTVENYRIYYGRTDANKYLHESYVESLKSAFTARQIEQYLEGKFVPLVSGRAHPEFRDDLHIHECDEPNGQQIYMGCDFNVDGLSFVLAYEISPDHIHVFKEKTIESNARIDRMVHECDRDGWGRYGFIKIHPDQSAVSRQLTSDSHLDVLAQTAKKLGWKFSVKRGTSNKATIDKIMKVNRYFLNAKGDVRLTIDPKCVKLIDSLRNIQIKGSNYDKDTGLDHICDALAYLIWHYQCGTVISGVQI